MQRLPCTTSAWPWTRTASPWDQSSPPRWTTTSRVPGCHFPWSSVGRWARRAHHWHSRTAELGRIETCGGIGQPGLPTPIQCTSLLSSWTRSRTRLRSPCLRDPPCTKWPAVSSASSPTCSWPGASWSASGPSGSSRLRWKRLQQPFLLPVPSATRCHRWGLECELECNMSTISWFFFLFSGPEGQYLIYEDYVSFCLWKEIVYILLVLLVPIPNYILIFYN